MLKRYRTRLFRKGESMQQKLKTIFINLLIITIPIIFIGTVIYIYRADDIVQVKNQTYILKFTTIKLTPKCLIMLTDVRFQVMNN